MKNEQMERMPELERQNRELEAQLEEARVKNEEYAVREAEMAIETRIDELIKDGRVAPSSREDFTKAALLSTDDGRAALFSALDKSPRIIGDGHFAESGAAAKVMTNQEIRTFAAEKGIDFETAVEVLSREGRIAV